MGQLSATRWVGSSAPSQRLLTPAVAADPLLLGATSGSDAMLRETPALSPTRERAESRAGRSLLAHSSTQRARRPAGVPACCSGVATDGATIPAVIAGAHTIIFAEDARRAREFLRDVLGFEGIDAGEGWLIFAMPPGEVAVHPGSGWGRGPGHHALFLMCHDIEQTVDELERKGVEFVSGIEDEGWGRIAQFKIPGAGEIRRLRTQAPEPASRVRGVAAEVGAAPCGLGRRSAGPPRQSRQRVGNVECSSRDRAEDGGAPRLGSPPQAAASRNRHQLRPLGPQSSAWWTPEDRGSARSRCHPRTQAACVASCTGCGPCAGGSASLTEPRRSSYRSREHRCS